MFSSTTPQITADEVYSAVQDKKDVLFLDVRTPGEYSKGHIENSIHLPVEEVATQIESVLPDKAKTVYVYCLSGSRSTVAVNVMTQLGYTNAFSMTNGLLMWRSKHYPLTV